MSDIQKAVQYIQGQKPDFKPALAIMLGSGLDSVMQGLSDVSVLSYKDVPGFPVPTVQGHAGELHLGYMNNVPVACLKGRVHVYEGEGLDALKLMIRSMRGLGVENLFLTNAVGSLREDVTPGMLVSIADHINMLGTNPLIGPNDDNIGPRFFDMGNAWDSDLRAVLQAAATDVDIAVPEGVYAAMSGPSFETPAEIRMLQKMGADTVGMSTVPECIIGNHCGLKVVGCSAITNMGAGMAQETLSHEQTLRGAKLAEEKMAALIAAFVVRLGQESDQKAVA